MDAKLKNLGIKPIRGKFVPATSSEIQELATRLGGALPPDYQQYLSSYGYARFDKLVSVPLPGGDHEAPIAVLFGGRDSGEALLAELTEYEEQLPSGFLPIARDPFSNLFLLDVAGENPGRIWYAVFGEKFQAVPVAHSFDELLDALIVDTGDEE